MFDREFFQNLLQQARQDFSQAHLTQHFTTAKSYLQSSGLDNYEQAAWSSMKPNDTLVYQDGTVSGQKNWISGLEFCSWAVVPVKHHDGTCLVVLSTQHLKTIPVITLGMEATRTVHFTCDSVPATILSNTNSGPWPTNHAHAWGFITNHLGLTMGVFEDLDNYTKSSFAYEKNKIKLDIEILHQIWQDQFDLGPCLDWHRSNKIYAFAKKTLTHTAQLATEITGSGLYDLDHPSHQRYRDILIYSTHMRNLNSAMNDIMSWSL